MSVDSYCPTSAFLRTTPLDEDDRREGVGGPTSPVRGRTVTHPLVAPRPLVSCRGFGPTLSVLTASQGPGLLIPATHSSRQTCTPLTVPEGTSPSEVEGPGDAPSLGSSVK